MLLTKEKCGAKAMPVSPLVVVLPGQDAGLTASQPQKGACGQNSTSKILPPPWGLLGANWRLAPSHQLIGALDPPAVTSVSAPNTRSLIFVHGGVGPGVRPVLGQVSPKGAGGQVGLDSSRFLAGFRSAAPAGAGGARRSAAREGQTAASKAGTVSSVEDQTAAMNKGRSSAPVPSRWQ
jgi:hypothetical protein